MFKYVDQISSRAVDCSQFLTQIIKFRSKLMLLERGLLDSADALDELHIKVKVADKDKEEGEAAGLDDDEEETIADFEKRINLFVLVQIRKFANRTRDSYKDGLVYQARKAVLADFFREVMLKRCQKPGCGAYVVLKIEFLRS